MERNQDTRERIESLIQSNKVVLFMKGTPAQPQCGFSAATAGILDSLVANYTSYNVLEDQALREGIKAYSNWPTIPQLYVDNEFLGGCDIVKEMFNTGALHQALGGEPPDRTPPEINVSDAAAEVICGALDGNPDQRVHLAIDARWDHKFNLSPASGHEIKAEANGIEILMDVGTAPRAKGLSIDITESLQGAGFSIDNPNAPPPVQAIGAQELKAKLNTGELSLIVDVRESAERSVANIEGSRRLNETTTKELESLPKDEPLVFFCHYGQRSQSAANYFRLQGFTRIYNLTGGINAWSLEVDPAVPRY